MNKLSTGAAAATVAALLTGGAALLSSGAGAVPASGTSSTASAQTSGARTNGAQTYGAQAPRRRAPRGIHGQATLRLRDGTFADRAWQRGSIAAKTENTITVRSADGATWTWAVADGTRFRRDGRAADLTTIGVGDDVVVTGTPATGGPGEPTAAAVIEPGRPARTG